MAAEVADDRLKSFEPTGEDVYTSGSKPIAQAAALKVIEILERDRIPEHVARMGAILTRGLQDLQAKDPEIGEVRGPGLFIGVEMVKDPETKEPAPVVPVRQPRENHRERRLSRLPGLAWRLADVLRGETGGSELRMRDRRVHGVIRRFRYAARSRAGGAASSFSRRSVRSARVKCQAKGRVMVCLARSIRCHVPLSRRWRDWWLNCNIQHGRGPETTSPLARRPEG
jgi:hypothetical protein